MLLMWFWDGQSDGRAGPLQCGAVWICSAGLFTDLEDLLLFCLFPYFDG